MSLAVDGFEIELDAELLLAFLGDLALEQLVGGRDEIRPATQCRVVPWAKAGRAARRGRIAGAARRPPDSCRNSATIRSWISLLYGPVRAGRPVSLDGVKPLAPGDSDRGFGFVVEEMQAVGLSARRSRSCILAVAVGSTEATIVVAPDRDIEQDLGAEPLDDLDHGVERQIGRVGFGGDVQILRAGSRASPPCRHRGRAGSSSAPAP